MVRPMIHVVRSIVIPATLAVLSLGAAQAETAGMTDPEFSIESEALVAATVAFFARVEDHTMPKRRLPVIGVPQAVTPSHKVINDPNALTDMGPVDHLTGYQISWYPMERLLGTVDFMGTWGGNRNLVCGYLTWDVSDPDDPVLENVSASFVDLGDLSDGIETEIQQGLLEANCAFGAIEENYHFFEVAG